MPQRAPSACRTPGCPGLVRGGVCSVCGPVQSGRSKWDAYHNSRNQESRHVRGYGNDWLRLRNAVLSNEPLCRECATYGRTTVATVVDHITPKVWGGTDDYENLQPLCNACHDTKTTQEVERGRLQKSFVPVTIVAGPPGSGKSTYVAGVMQPGDLLIDLDALFQAISNLPMYDHNRSALLPFVLDARWAMLSRLAKPSRVRHAWVITTEGDANKLRRMLVDLGAQLVVMRVDGDECLRRIDNDQRRIDRAMPWRDLVGRWWRQWTATYGDDLVQAAQG